MFYMEKNEKRSTLAFFRKKWIFKKGVNWWEKSKMKYRLKKGNI